MRIDLDGPIDPLDPLRVEVMDGAQLINIQNDEIPTRFRGIEKTTCTGRGISVQFDGISPAYRTHIEKVIAAGTFELDPQGDPRQKIVEWMARGDLACQ